MCATPRVYDGFGEDSESGSAGPAVAESEGMMNWRDKTVIRILSGHSWVYGSRRVEEVDVNNLAAHLNVHIPDDRTVPIAEAGRAQDKAGAA